MPAVSIAGFELHNVFKNKAGELWTREGFIQLLSPDVDSLFVGGFTVRSATTTEVWHYILSQNTNTGRVLLSVYTEELNLMFAVDLGTMVGNPVFTYAVVNNQLMINSPSMSAPLYGLPGGGLMPALKVDSINDDTTALDIPAGHICSFGDRMPIAQGAVVYFNDPGVDPRTYVSQNTLGLPGTIYDMFQGPDGGLWMFTSDGLYVMAADALGRGQQVVGFVRKVEGLPTSKPQSAVSTKWGVVCLTRTGIAVVDGGGGRQEIPFSTYEGRRKLTEPVEFEDIRQFGRLFETEDGVIVGFGDDRNFSVSVDLALGGIVTFLSVEISSFFIPRPQFIGVLQTRDGEDWYLSPSTLSVLFTTGDEDMSNFAPGNIIRGTLCGKLEMGPMQNPIVRRVSLSVANAGSQVAVCVDGKQDSGKTTSVNNEVVIGTSTWGQVAPQLSGLTARSTRCTVNVRSSEPNVEVQASSGGRRLTKVVEVEMNGTWTTKKDKQV